MPSSSSLICHLFFVSHFLFVFHQATPSPSSTHSSALLLNPYIYYLASTILARSASKKSEPVLNNFSLPHQVLNLSLATTTPREPTMHAIATIRKKCYTQRSYSHKRIHVLHSSVATIREALRPLPSPPYIIMMEHFERGAIWRDRSERGSSEERKQRGGSMTESICLPFSYFPLFFPIFSWFSIFSLFY